MTKTGLEVVVNEIGQNQATSPLTVTLRSGERVMGNVEEIASEMLVLKQENEKHFVTIEAIDVVTRHLDD